MFGRRTIVATPGQDLGLGANSEIKGGSGVEYAIRQTRRGKPVRKKPGAVTYKTKPAPQRQVNGEERIVQGEGGFGGSFNQRFRDHQRRHLMHSLVEQSLQPKWHYKGEEKDFEFFRKLDNHTSDEEAKKELEFLHQMYPEKTFEEISKMGTKVKRNFLAWFPRADMSRLEIRSHPDTGTNVFFGAWAIFGDQPDDEDKMSNPEVIKALGLDGWFPPKLTQNGNGRLSFPRTGFSGGFDTNIRIWSSEQTIFVINFRDIFKEQVVTFKSASACEKWKKGQDFSFWPQQLNLALWCATGGCGVSMNFKGLPKMIEGLMRFHIYFTTRRLLWEMGAALPGDSGFVVDNNPCSMPGVERVKNEFGIDDSVDFRWFHGSNGGFGNVFSWWNVMGKRSLVKMGNDEMHARYNVWPGGISKFSDEDAHHTKVKKDGFFGMFKDGAGGEDPNNIAFIQNDASSEQANWFLLPNSWVLTRAGMRRLNRSIEAFVFCVLGAQVNTRGSIVGNGGIAQNVRQELTELFEKAIIEESLSKSVTRYQEAIQNSKVKLDFAVAPGVWLLPSNLEINLESKEGYNNFLQKATEHMKFGKNDVNEKKGSKKTPPEESSGGVDEVEEEVHKPIFKTKTSNLVAEKHNDVLAAIAIVWGGGVWWLMR